MLDQADFAGIFSTRPQNFGWFLGAGTSRSAGLPTATDILWDLKRRFYNQQENQDLTVQDLQSDAAKERVQAFMDSRGFPALWSEEEYSWYFERIFGSDRERQRRYLRAFLAEDKATLTVGNRILGAMLAAGIARIVFTTNFDSIVEKAVADVGGGSLAAFHLEGSGACLEALNNEEYPIYCKLHGDFRYDSIKNLSQDLAQQNDELSAAMVAASTRTGLIVAGYSGRDASIMRLFHQALEAPNPFPNGLYWTCLKGSSVHPAVDELFQRGAEKGVKADLVEVETFDTFMLRLWRNVDEKPVELDRKVRRGLPALINIPLPSPGAAAPLLRLNALPISTLPTRCMKVELRSPLDWSALRAIQSESDERFLFTRAADVLCWGRQQSIEAAFGQRAKTVTAIDLPPRAQWEENLAIKGFVEEALSVALVRERPLVVRSRHGRSHVIVQSNPRDVGSLEPIASVVGKTSGTINGLFAPTSSEHPTPEQVTWAEAAHVSLSLKNGAAWLLIEPDIWIWPPRARQSAVEFLDQRRSDRLNQKANDLLDAWVCVLSGSTERRTAFEVSAFEAGDEAENPAFRISGQTAYSRRAGR